MAIKKYKKNPIITPKMVKPSNPEYKVRGAFNPGAVAYGKEIILLLRVAETCKQKEGYARVPIIRMEDGKGKADVLEISLDDPHVSLKDTRGVVYKGVDYLSTLSHIRLARSKDGYNFTVDDEPFLFPSCPEEIFGVEDARVTKINDYYYINYTAVSPDGWATALAKTKDFKKITRMGLIFCPQNKDVSIFPEKINGKYRALHRPNNSGFGKPSIWYAESTNLMQWGNHKCKARPRETRWEKLKIGGGAPSVKTKEGWLQIYHGKGEKQVYSLWAMLLDKNDPSKVLKRGKNPIIKPQERYEKKGFFSNCVFSNGTVKRRDGKLFIYYGACDNYVCVAETTVKKVLATL